MNSNYIKNTTPIIWDNFSKTVYEIFNSYEYIFFTPQLYSFVRTRFRFTKRQMAQLLDEDTAFLDEVFCPMSYYELDSNHQHILLNFIFKESEYKDAQSFIAHFIWDNPNMIHVHAYPELFNKVIQSIAEAFNEITLQNGDEKAKIKS